MFRPLKCAARQLSFVRHYSKEPEKINRHTILYKQFGKAFTKMCAITIGTYYGLLGLHDWLEYDLEKKK
ncbi:unnamed protein product [Debaryomyces tyrocola]|nr:unnamed protein product [Debaryomyces tyrocola]